MQNNAEVVKESGILVELVYQNEYFETTTPQKKIVIDKNDHSQLQNTYTVEATHNELLGSIIPDFFGFQALLLKDTTDNYVIAFRGTEFPHPWQTIADFDSDASMAIGNFTQQMEYAIRFIDAASKEFGISADQVTLTGHSLGGSLAEIGGYSFGCQTYSYNPFGVDGVVDNSDYTNFLQTQTGSGHAN